MPDSPIRRALRQRAHAITIADDRRSGRLAITFDRDFPGFDGHFAEQSIVPGLCFIQLAVILIEAVRSRPCRLVKVIRLKSLKPIQPGEAVALQVTSRQDQWRVMTTAPTGETVAQMLITVKDA
ncbi:MAG: hypothetical protein PHC30_05815 [Lentisphaeria bacterium]|jgi:3-hydroxymyristoyl/3-hydroxydecanoyl-(acyl carrier protein) dehydratase|nr:hypothetical protein [Lentisphaeria bacterium]